MKGLDTLIKLHKRELDELRRGMTSLETQKARLLELSVKLSGELQEEMKLASNQPEMARFFGDFSKKVKHRQGEIGSEVRQLEKQMEELNVKIAEAFAELKKFEIAKDNIKKRLAAEAARKETIMMDEIAEQQHRRKTQEENS